MVNYNEGKIYKIVCNVTGEVYIGSTCMPTLAKRLAEHRNGFKRWKEGKNKKHTRSFQIIERGDYSIVLIENVNCDTKEELLRRERFHIENNTCINKNIPLRTNAEYYLDNKEHIAEYNLKNKEEKKEYYKEYKLKNKEHIKEYYLENKEQIKQYKKEYYLENKDHLLEQQKEYKLKNKEHIKEYKLKNKEQTKEYNKLYRLKKKKSLNIIS